MSDHPSDQHESPFPDEELAELWKRQETSMTHTTDPRVLAHLAASIEAGHRAEQARLLWLNVREIVPIALLLVFFVYLGTTENPVLFVSSLLSLGVGLFLVGSSVRQYKIEQRFDATLCESVQRSLSQARHRLWMYRNAGWWYIVPIAMAVAILCASAIVDDPNGAKVGGGFAVALMAALFAGLFWWTRRIAATKWEPEVQRFEALLSELEQ